MPELLKQNITKKNVDFDANCQRFKRKQNQLLSNKPLQVILGPFNAINGFGCCDRDYPGSSHLKYSRLVWPWMPGDAIPTGVVQGVYEALKSFPIRIYPPVPIYTPCPLFDLAVTQSVVWKPAAVNSEFACIFL